MHKLNIGSGQRKFGPPWINVDKQAKWEPDVLWDAGNPLSLCPFEPGTCGLIVLHHCLEHLTLDGSKRLVQECHRLLVNGGRLLVFVPDLDALVRAWIAGRINDYILCVNLYGAYMGDEADLHRWGYIQRTLKDHLKQCASWSRISPFDWRYIPGSDLAKDWWVLATEATK